MAKQTATKSGGKVDMAAALAGVKKFFNKAKKEAIDAPERGAMPEFDDGRYIARLMSATPGKSASSGRNQVDFAWKFVDGAYAGQTKHDYVGIDNQQNLKFFFITLRTLGFEIDQLEDDKELLELLQGIGKARPHLLCQIALKTKGDFQNVFVNALLEDEEDGEESEQHEDEEDDDADAKRRKKAKKAKAAEADEEEEDDDEDATDADEDGDGDGDDDDEEEEEEKPKKAKKPAAKKGKKDEEEEEDEDEDGGDDDAAEEDEDEEEEEDEEETLHVSVGSEVVVETKDGKVKAEIIEIFPDEGKIRVKTAKGKTLRLPADRVVSVVEKTEGKKKAKK